MIRIVKVWTDSCGRALRTIRRKRKCVCDWGIRGYCFQKLLLTSMNFFLYKQNGLFLSRRQISFALLLYEQFIHLTQIALRPNKHLLSNRQHAYQSFFSHFLVLFGHTGWILDKNVNMNKNYSYRTTISKSILTQIYVCLVLLTIFYFYHEKFISKNCKNIFFYQKFVHLGKTTSIYCSRIIVVHVHANVFLLSSPSVL